MRKIQIGVMGSAADLRYSNKFVLLAKSVGTFIAKNNAALVFGAEKDVDSLSSIACRAAKKAGGLTIGITYGKGLVIKELAADIVIASGMERGGGREFVLALSCDVIIAINGGSGTLNEIVVAYQAGIPIIVIKGSGGWSQLLENTFIDQRKKVIVEVALSPEEAVTLAIARAREVYYGKKKI